MQQYLRGEIEPMRRLAREKAEAMRKSSDGARVYAESNHCFIKGFGWFLPEHIPQEKIGVVILRRDKAKIAESTLRIGCNPTEALGKDWIMTPEMDSPFIEPPRLLVSPKMTYKLVIGIKFLCRVVRALARRIFRVHLECYPQWIKDYEYRCVEWYVDETNAQAARYQERFPNITYFEANVDDLNSIEKVERMIAHFGLEAGESLRSVVGVATNLKR